MHADHFDITIDAGRSLLPVTMRGQRTTETVDRYEQTVGVAVARLLSAGCRCGNLFVLADVRELNAQSQNVIADFKTRMHYEGLLPRRPLTQLSSTSFNRQLQRIAIPNQRLFVDESDAISWPLSEEAET
ncbi:hypothetical protein [Sphingomonas sp. PAMC 26605]|uniref:hypothetical protein n=1 Tax=Sphingomonas sp. PAMC 26605 TaxID=1112214 RepID=UPI00026CAD25|nr:hypothetical protein [Sphingomonas sp. PAMC 26605]